MALLLAMTAGLWVASAVLIYFEVTAEGRTLFDESLSEAGTLLLGLAEHEIQEHGPALGVELMRAESQRTSHELSFQIWFPGELPAYRTQSAPEKPFLPLTASGFGWTTVNGEPWRAYATWNETRTLQIQIAEPLTRRSELSSWTYVHLAILAAVLLPLSMALIWWILTRSFQPLRLSATAVAQRSPDDLRPLAMDDTPTEVEPLITALNRLFVRMRDTLKHERRFTSDAAHELRSPLAAIRTNAQVMCGARDKPELTEAGADLLASVDRGSRLIDQLLMLARIDAGRSSPGEFTRIDLGEIVEAECDLQRVHAARKHTVIDTTLEPSTVSGISSLLAILVRNLVDNAVRYSPAHTHVKVLCGKVDGHIELSVADDGPGIPPEERERIFERFYRIVGNEATGSGLGLSIVRRVAELHGARLEVREGAEGRGAVFRVSFPQV